MGPLISHLGSRLVLLGLHWGSRLFGGTVEWGALLVLFVEFLCKVEHLDIVFELQGLGLFFPVFSLLLSELFPLCSNDF